MEACGWALMTLVDSEPLERILESLRVGLHLRSGLQVEYRLDENVSQQAGTIITASSQSGGEPVVKPSLRALTLGPRLVSRFFIDCRGRRIHGSTAGATEAGAIHRQAGR